MTTAVWFHCFSGVSGDMALGSLLDAGADLAEVRALVARLPVEGWELDAEPVLRCGIAGTKAHVRTRETTVVRTAAHIRALLEEARLPERARARALATFDALAQAEGRLHRKPPSQVHFHEVGGLDAIVDVVGTCAALEVLDVDEVHASTVTQGVGVVRAAHGLIPTPAPAVVELLRGAPVRSIDVGVELTTPTGAALLAAMVVGWGPMPALTIEAAGFGAGTLELDHRPNLLQAVIGERRQSLEQGQPVLLLETNVDDATGEVLAHTVEALLDAGAHDAWITPIVMKKGRPAHTVSVLADVALAEQLAAVLAAETGSLGVRGERLERWPASRLVDEVEVEGLPIRVKVSPGRVKVEQADAARIAARTGWPLREVLQRAEVTWLDQHPEHGQPRSAGDRAGAGELPGPIHVHPHPHGDDDPDRPHGGGSGSGLPRGPRRSREEPPADPAS
jgi:uncharacterized protein (TIGR00299 family) protein